MSAPGPGQPPQPHPSSLGPNPYMGQRGEAASSYPMMQQSPAPTQQMLSPTKDLNMVSMCRAGQEIVHDIVNKAQEFFKLLMPKEMQLPNNVTFHGQQFLERKGKLEEQLKLINGNFRKLRVIYGRVVEVTEHMEMPPERELVPYVGQETDEESDKEQSDSYLIVAEQHREMVEQVQQKNQQLKEVIDSIRVIVWEINTMVTMRGK